MESLILNFHGVGPVTRPMDQGELNCWLDQDFFEAVLDLARDHPQVGLTVDDGNVSDVTHILPALSKRGMRAVFFICSGRLGLPAFLKPTELRELLAEGMTIGSHGVDHRPWRGLSPEQLRVELETSRAVLEEVCGTSVDQAACPFGAYDRIVLGGLRRTGYRRVYTSDGGVSGEQNWIVPRTTVTRSMSLDEVRSLLVDGTGFLKQMSIRAKQLCKRLR